MNFIPVVVSITYNIHIHIHIHMHRHILYTYAITRMHTIALHYITPVCILFCYSIWRVIFAAVHDQTPYISCNALTNSRWLHTCASNRVSRSNYTVACMHKDLAGMCVADQGRSLIRSKYVSFQLARMLKGFLVLHTNPYLHVAVIAQS